MDINRKQVKVFVALNDNEERMRCIRILERFQDVFLVGSAVTGEEAFHKICMTKPEVVIAEVILPGLDAYLMMELLEDRISFAMPQFVLCYTVLPEIFSTLTPGNHVMHFLAFPMREKILERQLRMSVDYYQQNRVRQEVRNLKFSEEKNQFVASMMYEHDEGRWEKIVNYEMENFGAFTQYKGYRYLVDAICYVSCLEEDDKQNITQLYKLIASRRETTVVAVEKAIRKYISNIWKNGCMEYLMEFWRVSFITEDNRPSNSSFISYVAQKIKTDYYLLP